MSEESTDDLVHRAARGDREAMDRLFARLYPEVKQIVVNILRGRRKSIEATDVVDRVWEKLISQRDPKWQDRKHFLRFVVMVVRRVIADLPNPPDAITLSTEHPIADKPSVSFRDVDECLKKLEARGKVGARVIMVVWLRCLTNWTWIEIADALDVAERTVKGDWSLGKAYLRTCLEMAG